MTKLLIIDKFFKVKYAVVIGETKLFFKVEITKDDFSSRKDRCIFILFKASIENVIRDKVTIIKSFQIF